MISDRRKPGVAFWAIVAVAAVVVVLGYPLSFGPACWLADHEVMPLAGTSAAYRPLAVFVVRRCPEWVGTALMRYGEWGGGPMALMIPLERAQIEFERLTGTSF